MHQTLSVPDEFTCALSIARRFRFVTMHVFDGQTHGRTAFWWLHTACIQCSTVKSVHKDEWLASLFLHDGFQPPDPRFVPYRCRMSSEERRRIWAAYFQLNGRRPSDDDCRSDGAMVNGNGVGAYSVAYVSLLSQFVAANNELMTSAAISRCWDIVNVDWTTVCERRS